MTIVALTPAAVAAWARACPWFPAEAATTPSRACSGVSAITRLYAPRILNEPVFCRFSGLISTSASSIRDSVALCCSGVGLRTAARRPRAVSISLILTVIVPYRIAQMNPRVLTAWWGGGRRSLMLRRAELMRLGGTEPVTFELVARAVAAPVIQVQQQIADAAALHLVDYSAQARLVARFDRGDFASVAAAVAAKARSPRLAAEGYNRRPWRD